MNSTVAYTKLLFPSKIVFLSVFLGYAVLHLGRFVGIVVRGASPGTAVEPQAHRARLAY
jgi:hypothetical protein